MNTQTTQDVLWTIKCAWCGTVTRAGDDGAPVTHGVCDGCAARLRGEIARMTGKLISARRLTR